MGKKIPLLISTLIALGGGITIAPSVWADEAARDYWTVSELQPLSIEVDAEIEAACRDEYDFERYICNQTYLSNKGEDIYLALNVFRNYPFYISSINPSKGTVKVFYSGEDTFAKDMGSTSYINTLSDLYIVQFDRGFSSDFINDLDNGISDPHTHTLIYEKQATNGIGWFPSGAEVEFATPELAVTPNRENTLQFYFTGSTGVAYRDPYSFTSCVESPDYQDGMECRLIFKRSGYTYIPVAAVEEPATIGIIEEETTDELSVLDVNGYGGVSSIDNQSQESVTVPASSSTAEGASLVSAIAPNTGAFTREYHTRDDSVEFPWWVAGILAIGTAFAVWLFWPVRRKNRRK